MSKSKQSYSNILKSSSVIGGAQGINYAVGIARTKIVAVLLGPSGVGTVALFEIVLRLISTIASLGISNSGIREVAASQAREDGNNLALTVLTMRRACWVTGAFAWLVCVLLARPLSQWTFESPEKTAAFAILGFSLLLTSVNSGQMALVQGSRRIGDIARISILSAIFGLIVSSSLYGWLGEKGIVPVMIATAGVNILFSWHYARKIPVPDASFTWVQSFNASGHLIRLGLAFLLSGLLVTGVSVAIRALIVRMYGIEACGIYQAAFGISGVFAGFILAAMGTDFYPRLTAASHDRIAGNLMVNQQTEIGILLALPGLVGTISFAPFLMRILYSDAFIEGAVLLPLFVLGVFGRVLSWPLGYLLLSKGQARWFAITETVINVFHLLLALVLIPSLGLMGAAMAFAIVYVIYTSMMLLVTRRNCGFRWSTGVWQLFACSATFLAFVFIAEHIVLPKARPAVGVLLVLMTGALSMRGIVSRLGTDHHLIKMMMRLPGFSLIHRP